MTGEHGLVLDNVVEVTVVTADGSILKADDTENSDLFCKCAVPQEMGDHLLGTTGGVRG